MAGSPRSLSLVPAAPVRFRILACAVLLGALLWALSALADNPVSGPRRSSSCLTLTGDGTTVVVVNPDSNSISLVDVASLKLLAEIQVGLDPRCVAVDATGSKVYVSDRESDTLSVVDLASRKLVATVQTGDRPYGVVFDQSRQQVYVAEQGAGAVRILNAANLQESATVATPERPSGLLLSPDSKSLYVTHLLSNVVSVIDLDSRTITAAITLWPDSNLVQAIALAPDGQTAFVPHSRSNTANRALSFDTTVFPIISAIRLSDNTHLVGQHIALETVDPPGVGLPFDAAVSPDGGLLWSVNAASNDLTVVDLATRQKVAHIEVQDNPRGIVISADGKQAFVNNTLAGTVSVIDTASFQVTQNMEVTRLPLPPILLNGKRLFFSSNDPRMSRAQWIACNTCHYEGEHDGRTWFFGFAGPRNTTSLLGMVQTYPLRWSGEWNESADCEYVIRKENFGTGLLTGDMNCNLFPPDCVNQAPNQGRSYDLDCLAAFMDSLGVPLSPAHARGEPLSAAALRGRAFFEDSAIGCAKCHPAPLYTDLKPHDVGTTTSDEKIGPAFDTPTLRGLYGSAPYFHDGSALTLRDTLVRPTANGEHDVRTKLNDSQMDDLVAFLQALPYEK
jgi:YVTN family beta-propeller protein